MRLALVVFLVVALTALVIQKASAHTPSGGASCDGYFVKATNYESRNTNYISSTFDGTEVKRQFATNDQITGTWPQDAKPHTWSGYVHTNNSNPAYSKDYGPITLTCGTQPQDDVRYRDVTNPVDCRRHTITTLHEKSTRSYTFDYQTSTWVAGDWSPWAIVSAVRVHTNQGNCTFYRHAHVRVHVTDKCNCWRDKVVMFGNHDKVRIHKSHPTRLTWKFTVVGKKIGNKQYQLPRRIGGSHGWANVQYYTVHTTNKDCPCHLHHNCPPSNTQPPHHHCKGICHK